MAAVCGESPPDGFQSLLSRAHWDAEARREARCRYVVPPLGASHGVLVLDDTGCPQKGRHSAGVARQYRGTRGHGAPCHIGVLLRDASPRGDARRDRDLSLPQQWTAARERCQQAGIAEDRGLAPTPPLAQQRRARTFAAGVAATGGTGDSGDGDDRRRRLWWESQRQASVLAVSGTEEVGLGSQPRHGHTLLAGLPAAGGTRRRAGDGAQGPRWYDWCWRPLADPLAPGWRRWLLVRRSLGAPTELTASAVVAPPSPHAGGGGAGGGHPLDGGERLCGGHGRSGAGSVGRAERDGLVSA